jgi:hypothetical protein
MFSSPDASVYQRVLGPDFARLDERLRRYFGPIPRGGAGVGTGEYDVAGLSVRALRPVFAWLAWRHILFPELGRHVPFTVTNTPDAAGSLSAVRTFALPGRTRVMEDTMSVVDGRLIDRLGRRRGLEVDLHPAVVDGGLRLTSGRCALRMLGIRTPLPTFARVTIDERVDPADPSRQRVDVRLRLAGVGEVFRYAGSFAYRIVSETSASDGRTIGG